MQSSHILYFHHLLYVHTHHNKYMIVTYIDLYMGIIYMSGHIDNLHKYIVKCHAYTGMSHTLTHNYSRNVTNNKNYTHRHTCGGGGS
jgi:hypothetical protein